MMNFYTRLAKHLLIIAILMIVLFPVLYIVAISFNRTGGLSLDILDADYSLNNWKYVLKIPYQDGSGNTVLSEFPILRWLWNSIKISFITAVIMLMLSTTAAYALSRFRFKGRQTSLATLMLIQMFPSTMAMVAFYIMLDYIGGYTGKLIATDTHLGLILVYLGGTPFNVWLIKGYFDTIPKSIEESAIMDGCSRFQAFIKIILPLCTPILAVVALISFINTFADFLLPSILLKSMDKLTFATGIQIFITETGSGRWGQFAAACIIGALPTAILFFAIHRQIVSGLGAGATKG